MNENLTKVIKESDQVDKIIKILKNHPEYVHYCAENNSLLSSWDFACWLVESDVVHLFSTESIKLVLKKIDKKIKTKEWFLSGLVNNATHLVGDTLGKSLCRKKRDYLLKKMKEFNFNLKSGKNILLYSSLPHSEKKESGFILELLNSKADLTIVPHEVWFNKDLFKMALDNNFDVYKIGDKNIQNNKELAQIYLNSSLCKIMPSILIEDRLFLLNYLENNLIENQTPVIRRVTTGLLAKKMPLYHEKDIELLRLYPVTHASSDSVLNFYYNLMGEARKDIILLEKLCFTNISMLKELSDESFKVLFKDKKYIEKMLNHMDKNIDIYSNLVLSFANRLKIINPEYINLEKLVSGLDNKLMVKALNSYILKNELSKIIETKVKDKLIKF
jgi:hypothetical protein